MADPSTRDAMIEIEFHHTAKMRRCFVMLKRDMESFFQKYILLTGPTVQSPEILDKCHV
jgi:hypothetical protein